jgi:small conductance mechanosensitive channel
VRVWVAKADYWGVFFDTTEKVKLTFDAEGISIPFPQRDIHLYQEK